MVCIIFEKHIYGKAVNDAHMLEKEQNWIGIVLHKNIPNNLTQSCNHLVSYPVPTDTNEAHLYNAVSWDVPDFPTLIAQTNIYKAANSLRWYWVDRVNNTGTFGLYLKFLALAKKDNNKAQEYYHPQPLYA